MHPDDKERLDQAEPFIIGVMAFAFMFRKDNGGPLSALIDAKQFYNAWYNQCMVEERKNPEV